MHSYTHTPNANIVVVADHYLFNKTQTKIIHPLNLKKVPHKNVDWKCLILSYIQPDKNKPGS